MFLPGFRCTFVRALISLEGQRADELALCHTGCITATALLALGLYTEEIFDIFDFTGDRSSCATGAADKQGIYLPMTTGLPPFHMPQTHMCSPSLPVLPHSVDPIRFFPRAPPHNGRNRSRRLVQ